MTKISYLEYQSMLLDPDVSEEKIIEYSTMVRGETLFDWVIQPNPDKVDISEDDLATENAMSILNHLFRARRAGKFRRRRRSGSKLPVIVSEGDSWFQFPLLIKEVIDHLQDEYLIWSVGAAGDTAKNMVGGEQRKYKSEYMRALQREKRSVKAFLFSAAGNDIIGEDPESGRSALFEITHPFNGDENDIYGHINENVLTDRLDYLEGAYRKVIQNVHGEPGLEDLPILIHGYDYVYPYPQGADDPRRPFYAKNDEWLGEPLKKRNIPTKGLGREIVKELIDQLYNRFEYIANDSTVHNVWVVDCRGAIPNLSDWNDEIHGTSDGFANVAHRFRDILSKAI